jgi:type IV pilus assembly protein PilB
MIIDETIQDLILKMRPAIEINQAAIETGSFKTLKENAIEKVLKGITTLEEVASLVMD